MSDFTPGPWKVLKGTENPEQGYGYVVGNGELEIAVTLHNFDLTKEDQANARLIAAAPLQHRTIVGAEKSISFAIVTTTDKILIPALIEVRQMLRKALDAVEQGQRTCP